MTKPKFNNPWDHKNSIWYNGEKDKWFSGSLHEPASRDRVSIEKGASFSISPFFKRTYPSVTRFLRESMPSLIKNDTVILNLSTLSRLSIKVIRRILTSNQQIELSRYGLKLSQSGWMDEGYPDLNEFLKARNLNQEDLENWNPSIANVGQGLTVPPNQNGAIESWICIYIRNNFNARLERFLTEKHSELSINFAAIKFQYMRLFLHEFTHYCQNLTGFFAVQDAPPEWDNGAQFEYKTFGFTETYRGAQVSETSMERLGTGISGILNYLDNKEILDPILEGITWNSYNLSSIQRRIKSTGQDRFYKNSNEN